MLKNKRKRAVVLALIAFFCTAATTYVAVDWKRFGGGFLAMFRGKGDTAVASKPTGGAGGSDGVQIASADGSHDAGGSLPRLSASNGRKHTAGMSSGAGGGHKSDEDLFKYGDPAAGGIPPGRFVVADNAGGGGGGAGGGDAPAVPQITSPAPQPGGTPESAGAPGPSNGGLTDSGLTGKAATPPAPATPTPPSPPSTPVTPTPPVSGPPADTPPSPPAEPPIQSGTTDPGDPAGTPTTPSSPVSAVPEASTTSMMALGALFLAVAAARQRKQS